jgi:diguanylate cyclase (GGDEF)-like protein/PAS domain S-box-containing protein
VSTTIPEHARTAEEELPMAIQIRALIVEDSPVDALVIVRELQKDGFDPIYERVQTEAELRSALEHPWDVILADFVIPEFGGLDALAVLQELGLDIPFIMVSGKMGEDFAVEAMKAGVQDYIVKNNLSRLGPALRRELKEADDRRQRRRTEEALREIEERFKATFEQAAVGLAHLTPDGGFLRTNRKLSEIVGYPEKELSELTLDDLSHPDDRDKDAHQHDLLIIGQIPTYAVEKRFLRREGSRVWVNLTISKVSGQTGETKYLIAVIEDISGRKKSERALRESERKFRFVFEGASIGIAMIDMEGKFSSCNYAFSSMLHFSEKEVVGRQLTAFTHPDDRASVLELHNRLLNGRMDQYQFEQRFHRKDGQVIWGRFNVSLIHDDQGRPQFALAMVEDVTTRKYAEEKIQYMALYDAVTDLPNRTLFFDRLHQAVSRAHRNQYVFALLFIDLDRFKEINDMHGHSTGDKVLKEVALRLKECIRETDTACRLGGDEFAIILQDIQEIAFAEKVAQKIIRSISRPFVLGEIVCSLSASIGISFYPFDGEDVDILIKNADLAMYRVKRSTRNAYLLFSETFSVPE